MTRETLREEIHDAIDSLLHLGRLHAINAISDNCVFILSEIRNDVLDVHELRKITKRENDRKTPISLGEILPKLEAEFENLYDVNLYIYRASKHHTVVDIRCFLRSSLNEEYRQKVINDPPMLHSKVALPPWLSDKHQRFDINWERKITYLKLHFLFSSFDMWWRQKLMSPAAFRKYMVRKSPH